MSILIHEINSVDVSLKVQSKSTQIVRRVTSNPDTGFFEVVDPDTVPLEGQEVHIYLDDTSQNLFKGIISSITRLTVSPGVERHQITCSDFERLFNRRLVNNSYTTQTFNAIILDIVANFTDPAIGFTTNNVGGFFTPLTEVKFSFRSPSDCLRELAEIIDWQWFIDEDKDIHFISKQAGDTDPSPFNITDDTLDTIFTNLAITLDYSQVRNKVIIQGGNFLKTSITENFVGNAATRSWALAYPPVSPTLTVGGGAKTLGRDNIDADDGTFEYFYNTDEKNFKAASAEATPGNGVAIVIAYNYNAPGLFSQENTQSQTDLAALEGGDGVYEYVFKDNTLDSDAAIQGRAAIELEKNAFPELFGSVDTINQFGFEPGQLITIDMDGSRYNGTYNIEQVTITSLGGSTLRYSIDFGGKFV